MSPKLLIHGGLAACILGAPTAHAQSLMEALAGLKFCRSVKDDALRLKCYDQAIPEGAKAPDTEVVPTPEWRITESKSPIDDSEQIAGILTPTGDTGTGLLIRCMEHKTEVAFSPRGGFFASTKPASVTVRIGDGKPIVTNWSVSTTNQAVFAPAPVQFLKALPDDGKLFIRATGWREAFDATFELGKVSLLRDRIAKACKWPKQ